MNILLFISCLRDLSIIVFCLVYVPELIEVMRKEG